MALDLDDVLINRRKKLEIGPGAAQKRHREQRIEAEKIDAEFQAELEQTGNKRSLRQKVPDYSGVTPDFGKSVRMGARLMDEEASGMAERFRESGIGSEQNRPLSVQKEHAISIAGDPKQKIERTPTQYGIYQRGSDYHKSQFSGSGRFNVTQGAGDAFTIRQMRNIGRPANWLEAITDDKAFGDNNLVDVDNNDWLRLQQGQITDDQLISHKTWVKDQASQGNIWIDAQSTEELVQDIDVKEGKESLVRHEGKKSKKQLKIERSKWPDIRDYTLTKLERAGLKIGKVTGKLSKADAMAQMGMNIATGNIPGAVINASMLSAQLVGQSPAVQKKFAELAIKIVAERGAKTTAKLVPGLDVGLSAVEAWGYLSEGKLDQAGIAALSGAIGWVPGVGDFGAALLDATNTGIDIARLKIPKQQPKGEIITSRPGPGNQRRTLKSIARDIQRGI